MSHDENTDAFHQSVPLTSPTDVQKAANSDLACFEKIRSGDSSAFSWLFRKYYEPLYFFATRWIRDTQVAEDIVQDLFVKLWTNRQRLQIESNLKSYLYRAVKNRTLNIQKQVSKMSHPEDQSSLPNISNSTPEQELIEKEKSTAIHRAIDDLPKKCRQIYLMKRYDNLTYGEIAEILDISINTVKTHMKRALKILLKKLAYLIIYP